MALESKGEQLENPDTTYKRSLLDKLTEAYGKDASGAAGELDLKADAPDYEVAVVLFGEMDAHLSGLIQASRSKGA